MTLSWSLRPEVLPLEADILLKMSGWRSGRKWVVLFFLLLLLSSHSLLFPSYRRRSRLQINDETTRDVVVKERRERIEQSDAADINGRRPGIYQSVLHAKPKREWVWSQEPRDRLFFGVDRFLAWIAHSCSFPCISDGMRSNLVLCYANVLQVVQQQLSFSRPQVQQWSQCMTWHALYRILFLSVPSIDFSFTHKSIHICLSAGISFSPSGFLLFILLHLDSCK